MYESPYSVDKKYAHHVHVRFSMGSYVSEGKLHDATLRASREVISLFPMSKIEIDPSNLIDLTSYPFESKSDNEVLVLEDNQKPVFQSRGFMAGMPLNTDDCYMVEKDDVLARVYNEQFAYRLRFSSYAKTQKEEDIVTYLIRHIINNIDFEDVSLLSIQRENMNVMEGIDFCSLEEYLPEKTTSRRSYPTNAIEKNEPDYLTGEHVGFFDQNPSIAKALFGAWEAESIELEKTRLICHTNEQDGPVYCDSLILESGKKMVITTLAKIDKTLLKPRVIGSIKCPLWKISKIVTDDSDLYEVSRLIEIPASPNIEKAFECALAYPMSTTFGDRYGFEYNVCLSISDIGKLSVLLAEGLILEREVSETGDVYFSFLYVNETGGEEIIYEGSEIGIVHYLNALNSHDDTKLTISSAVEVALDMPGSQSLNNMTTRHLKM